MNRKSKVIVSIVGITIVLLALLGLTYAYYLTRIEGNTNTNSISVTTADLKVVYGENSSEVIVKENVLPGEELAEKTFTVTNDGTGNAKYSIIIDNMQNKFKRNQDLKYTLKKSGESNPIAYGVLAAGTHQILVPEINIEEDDVHSYTLTLNYLETGTDQSIDMGSTLSFRVNIGEPTITWDTAPEGTLLYALKTNQPIGSEETIPGQMASVENEARIIETEDDYGTSYIYRGSITNNYVTYSNMCWRVIRVQGDGTIKLVLADENEACNPNSDSTPSAFINSATEYPYYTGDINSDSGFLEWQKMFIYETSNIPSVLETWMNDNNFDKSKLINTDYCNDRSYVGGEDNSYVIYGALNRLYPLSTATPSLKCSSDEYRVNTNIALLTADEVAYAGFTEYGSNTTNSNYLITEALHTTVKYGVYYTMSPATIWNGVDFWGDGPAMYMIENSRLYGNGGSLRNTESFSIRPVITIRSDVKITTNEQENLGTWGNAYIIN